MIESFEIYFVDLTDEAQKRFLEFEKLETEKEGNFDVFPIAIVDNDLLENRREY